MGFINYKYNAIEVKYNPGIDPQKQLKAEASQHAARSPLENSVDMGRQNTEKQARAIK